MKHAFTLIELLVVIGIIGVLSAALLMASGGATEAARAAKCLSNIRSLAAAVQARAMDTSTYPLAGSREVLSRKFRDEQVGWISWLSNHGDPYANHTPGKAKPDTHQNVEKCPFYGTVDPDDATYAITNGAIWRYVGRNRDVYVCPEHVRYRQKRGMKVPQWSYVMNMKFGFDNTLGSDATAVGGSSGVPYNRLELSDRKLMFAELPTVSVEGGAFVQKKADGDEHQCDCTLNYKQTYDGKEYGKEWKGPKSETIGFNHPLGKGVYCGHVAFADGHVEKISFNPRSGGMTPEQLTALLCEGVDLSYNGTEWKKIQDQD